MRFKVIGNCPQPHGAALPEVMTCQGLVDSGIQGLSPLASNWEKPEDLAQFPAGLSEASFATALQLLFPLPNLHTLAPYQWSPLLFKVFYILTGLSAWSVLYWKWCVNISYLFLLIFLSPCFSCNCCFVSVVVVLTGAYIYSLPLYLHYILCLQHFKTFLFVTFNVLGVNSTLTLGLQPHFSYCFHFPCVLLLEFF